MSRVTTITNQLTPKYVLFDAKSGRAYETSLRRKRHRMANSGKPVPKGTLDILSWTNKELHPYMIKQEVNLVLAEVKHKPLYHLIINFHWQTGARVSEALAVKVSDIDFYSKLVRMPSLKKKNPQIKTIPLQGELIGEIGAYIGQEGQGRGTGYYRQHAHSIVKKACLNVGIEEDRSHPHVLRHSFAVNAVLQRVPLPILQKWMGHSNIQSTMIYLQILNEDTRDFYERLVFQKQ